MISKVLAELEATNSRHSSLQQQGFTLDVHIGGYFWIDFMPDLFLTKLVRVFNAEQGELKSPRDLPPTSVRSPLITARANDVRSHLIELTHARLSELNS